MVKFKSNKSVFVGRTSVTLSSLVLSTSLLLSTTAPLKAADFTVTNGQTLTDTTVTLATGETGTIQAGGTIEDSAANAIIATGNVTIDNAGTVTTTANDGIFHTGGTLNLFNHATGIITGVNEGVDAGTLISNLTNSGAITGGGFGVFTAGTITNLTNSGTINGGTLQGVLAGVLISTLTNSGTIKSSGADGVFSTKITTLTNSGNITGADNGVESTTSITTLTNSGTITGANDGVLATNDFITNLTNSGTITGKTDDGIQTTEITSLTNSGTIIGADYGVHSSLNIVSIVNSGTIDGGNYGVRTGTSTSFVNSGTINGGNYGVRTVTLRNLINSGTITGGDQGVQAVHITNLTNSGKITGGTNAILEIAATEDTLLTLLPGSDISGAINLGGGTNTLVIGNGLSIDHTFATPPDAINSNSAPSVTLGNRVITLDTTAFAQQDDLMFDLSGGILGTVFNQIGRSASTAPASAVLSYAANSNAASSSIDTSFSDSNGDDRFHMWADLFASHRSQAANGLSSGARHNLGGLVIGLDSQIGPDTLVGAFVGASITNIDTNANQKSDVKSLFAGLYSSHNLSGLTVGLGVTAGITDHNDTRQVDNNLVNGVQTVSSNFNGTFIAPEISISGQYDMGGTVIQPTLSAGYTGVFLDGYTETGTSAPLTVASRDMHLLHARLELAALLNAEDDSSGAAFSPYIGIEGRSLIGGNVVSATLLGQSVSFTPSGADNTASVFVGGRLSVLQTEDLDVFAGFEASYDTEQSATITGKLRFNWQF